MNEQEMYIEYLKKILKRLDKGYKTEWGIIYGLCGMLKSVARSDWLFHQRIECELEILKERRNVFYNVVGIKTNDKEQFIWRPNNKQPRVKFIQRLIKEANHRKR